VSPDHTNMADAHPSTGSGRAELAGQVADSHVVVTRS